ncbi:MAG TPA: hypothetical protein VJ377_05265 [Dehalococcoidales bacterium]|nr:hypothetical protein [Dehalococcoidales bacterium]
MRVRTVLSILASLALLVSLAPAVMAAEDTVSGSFTPANVTPTVSAVEIYSDAALTSVANSLTPQVMYFIKVTAADGNTIEDIDQIDVELFYDAAGADPAAPGAPNAQTAANITWDKDGGGSEWVISAGSPTSWAITSANCSIPGAMTASSGDWVFAVTLGKVATESVGAADWDLYARANDAGGSGEAYTRDKEVLWYGEIATSASADFGSVAVGSGFADNTNEVTGISVNYITNGDYDQQVKSGATWAGATYTGNYDATGATGSSQQFSLNAYISDTFASRVQVDTTGASIDATGTITSETGNTVANNTLWLRVASVFAIDTYSGTITYIIADR